MRRWVRGVVAGVVLCAGLVPAVPASAVTDDPPTAGPVTLQAVRSGRVADLENSGVESGRRIQEWTYNATAAQRWTLSRSGDSYRIASAVNPAFCLARESDAAAPGRVVLRPCTEQVAHWQLQRHGAEQYRIRAASGGSFLRDAGSRGGDLTTGPDDGAASLWYLGALAVPRRPMPADPRLDQLTFLTAHNAMANSDEGFGWRFPNQSYRLRDQLRHGVRGLQIDAHPNGREVRLCHGSCLGNERTLSAVLQDVVDFLRESPSAVVTVFIEDYTSVAQLGAALARVDGLTDLMLRPDTAGVRERGWPRLSELVASNRRLLMFSQSPGREALGVMYDRNWLVENYWSLGGGGNDLDCYSRWSEVALSAEEPGFRRLHVMNHFRNIPTESAANSDNGAKLRDRAERLCGPAARRKPNFVAVDFYQKADNAPSRLVADLNGYW